MAAFHEQLMRVQTLLKSSSHIHLSGQLVLHTYTHAEREREREREYVCVWEDGAPWRLT